MSEDDPGSNQDIHAILAANIEKYRNEIGISQEKLSEECGLHKSYVGRLVRTCGNCELSTMKLLANRFGITVARLLTPTPTTTPRRRR